MSPEFEKLLMDRLSLPKQANGYTTQDLLAMLGDDLRKRDMNSQLEKAFMQTLHRTNNDPEFEQSLTSVISKDNLAMWFGASIAGQVGGLFQRYIPINLGIGGVPAIIGGYVLKKYVAKGGSGAKVADGIMTGGGAVAISGFTGGLGINNILGGSAIAPTQTQQGNVMY